MLMFTCFSSTALYLNSIQQQISTQIKGKFVCISVNTVSNLHSSLDSVRPFVEQFIFARITLIAFFTTPSNRLVIMDNVRFKIIQKGFNLISKIRHNFDDFYEKEFQPLED
ncbi:CLUMA_CG003714, isoform A [Clunio marinus]|uniref:CLUMA_CG003714, isoform A n=1 Tax=Clunio marinus TaxID=568069 RepID=A0A1J1HPU6_9DIPT|nr:CLUMA_CG003714, isoform A [Clunio marinus]